MKKQISVKDRRWRLKIYKDCFVSKDAIDWICKNISNVKNNAEAVKYGQLLESYGLVSHGKIKKNFILLFYYFTYFFIFYLFYYLFIFLNFFIYFLHFFFILFYFFIFIFYFYLFFFFSHFFLIFYIFFFYIFLQTFFFF